MKTYVAGSFLRRYAHSFAGALILSLIMPAQAAQTLFFDFEEGSGTSTADREPVNAGDNTGNLTSGAVFSSTTTATPSSSSFSLSLDGADDHVTIANQGSLLQGVTGFTLAAFVRLDTFADAGSHESVIFVSGGTNIGQARGTLQVGSNGSFAVGGRRADGDSFSRSSSADSQLQLNTWAHIAATVAFSSSGPSVKLYLNGQQVTSGAAGFSSGATSSGTSNLTAKIGSNGGATGEFVDGFVDDTRIYNTVLSQTEIAALAIPEPSSALLLGLGAIALVTHRRRN